MNKLLRLLALFLALIMLLCACANDSGSNDDDEDDEDEDIVSDKDKDEDNDKDDDKKDPEDDDDKKDPVKNDGFFGLDPEIEETVFYDDNDVTLTATGINNKWDYPTYEVTVDNHSDKHVAVTIDRVIINGYMPFGDFGIMYIEVPAGETAEAAFELYDSDLQTCGIEVIADLSFYVNLSDYDSYDTIDEGTLCTLETGNEGYQQKVDDGGEEIVNENGFRVVLQDYCDDEIYGFSQIVYFENTSNHHVTFDMDNIIVNGCVSPHSSTYVNLLPNTRTVTYLSLSDLARVGIQDAGDIENCYFDLYIYNADDYLDYFNEERLSYIPGDKDFRQNVDDFGMEIFNQDGIRVIQQGAVAEEHGISALFFIENTYGEAINLTIELQEVNGQETFDYINVDLYDNTLSINSYFFWDGDFEGLEKPEDLESMKLILSVREIDSYDPVAYESMTVELN